MTNIMNLTPHVINIVGDGAQNIAPSGKIARVAANKSLVGNVAGIPVFTTAFGDVVDLPQPQHDTFFIVSRLVKSACLDRNDVLVPGDPVRDGNGVIIGCNGLSL